MTHSALNLEPEISSSRLRLYMTSASTFIPSQQCSQPPCFDTDGHSPIYFGSARFAGGIHPCKIVPHLSHPCRVPYGGVEYLHPGSYTLLPYDPDTMEFVPSSHGQIPSGRRPVEGGYESHGAKLYHAVAELDGIKMPGKTGTHLLGCNVGHEGSENIVAYDYEILCWKRVMHRHLDCI